MVVLRSFKKNKMKINNEEYYIYNAWGQILNEFKILFKTRTTGVLVSLCPFHLEKTPSCLFWPQSGNFKCFGCGETGDKLYFILRILNESRLQYKTDFGSILQNKTDLERILQDNLWVSSSISNHLFVSPNHPEFPFMAKFV